MDADGGGGRVCEDDKADVEAQAMEACADEDSNGLDGDYDDIDGCPLSPEDTAMSEADASASCSDVDGDALEEMDTEAHGSVVDNGPIDKEDAVEGVGVDIGSENGTKEEEEDDDELRALLAQVRKTLPLEEGEIMDADRRTELMDIYSDRSDDDDEALIAGDGPSEPMEGDDFYDAGELNSQYHISPHSEYAGELNAHQEYYDEPSTQEWGASSAWYAGRAKSQRKTGHRGTKKRHAGRGGRGSFSTKQAWQSGRDTLTNSSGWVGDGYGDAYAGSGFSARSYVKSDPALVINLTDSDLASSDSDSDSQAKRWKPPKKSTSPTASSGASLGGSLSMPDSGISIDGSTDLEKELLKKKQQMQKLKLLLAQKREHLRAQKQLYMLNQAKDAPPSASPPLSGGTDISFAQDAEASPSEQTEEQASLQEVINKQTEVLGEMARRKKAIALQLQKDRVAVNKFAAELSKKSATVKRFQSLLERAKQAEAVMEAKMGAADERGIRSQLQLTQVSRQFDDLQREINDGLCRLASMEAARKRATSAPVASVEAEAATKEEKVRQLQELLEQEKSHLKTKQVSFIQEQKSRVKSIESSLRKAENVRLAKLSKAAAAEEAAELQNLSTAQKMRKHKLKQKEQVGEDKMDEDGVRGLLESTTVPLSSLGGIVDVPVLQLVAGVRSGPSDALRHDSSSKRRVVTFAGSDQTTAWQPLVQRDRESVAGTYISPLRRFRAYRLSPYFKSLGSQLLSPEMTVVVDPMSIICRFELHGTCNDPDCPWQHLSDRKRTPSEALQYLADLAQRRDGCLSSSAMAVLKKASRYPAEILAQELVLACNEERSDCHFLPLEPPPATDFSTFSCSASYKRTSVPLSTIDLLGIRRSATSSDDDDVVVAVDPAVGERELSGLDTLPVYEASSGLLAAGSSIDSRYYLSKQGALSLDETLRKDPSNVRAWIAYALQEQEGTRDILVILRRLARAVENNRTSVELWCLYMKYFFRAGKYSEARQLLEKATTEFVPLSYSLWHLRWVFSASVSQKLSISVAAVEQFSAASEDALDPTRRSAILVNFLLSFAFVLTRDGKSDFVQRRLTYFLLNAASQSPTAASADPGTLSAYPSVSRFLATPDQASALWSLLVARDRCTVMLQLAHLIMVGSLPLTAVSFYSYVRPFAIDWSTFHGGRGDVSFDAKRMLTSAIFKAVAASLDLSPSLMVSFYANYVAFELAYGGFDSARAIAQAALARDRNCPELVALAAEAETLAAPNLAPSTSAVRALVDSFEAAFPVLRGSPFVWYRLVSALLHLGERKRAIAALVASVSPPWQPSGSMPVVASKEEIATAQKSFCESLGVEFRGLKEADELLNELMPMAKASAKAGDHERLGDAERIGSPRDVFLWLNFVTLLSLTSVKEDVCHVFHQGLLQLTDHETRAKLLEEYFRWRCSVATSEDIFHDLDQFAYALGPVIDSPLEDEILPDLRDDLVHGVLLPAPAENYCSLDLVAKLVLMRFPARRCESILALLIRRFPRNARLHTRLGDLMASHGRHNAARRSFASALKICPQLEQSWRSLLALEVEQETAEADVRFLFQAALRALPESFSLWGMYQEFELTQALKAKHKHKR